jgi:alpha-L-rhamnosidase
MADTGKKRPESVVFWVVTTMNYNQFSRFGLLLLAVILLPTSLHGASPTAPHELCCEYLTDPLGIDTAVPRFNWKLSNPEAVRGQKQSAWRVMVASSKERLERNEADLWDSGRVDSSQSTLVPYGGKKLASNQDCYWKVCIHDKDQVLSEWSNPARFTMGLLQPSDWKGPWIRHPDAPVAKHIWFRRNLELSEPVRLAFIHVASLGYHELYVNGKKFDDRLLGPAATRLDKRVLYMTYDISSMLRTGENTIALWQGPGWGRYAFFKTMPALRVQLDGVTAAGKSISLASDTTWRCEVSSSENIGGTKFSDNGGERIDSRKVLTDWNAGGFDDANWQLAAEVPIKAELSAQMMEPTRIIETIPARAISSSASVYKVDMGKNFTGWVEIKFKGLSAGDLVTFKVADDYKAVQDFGQKCEFISNGKDGEVFRNRFNYISGRYLTLEGLKSRPDPSDVTGYALSTDVKRTGKFSSSNDLLNQIYEADLWTWRANLVEGFTMDCPHRERLGYGEVAFACAWGIAFPNYQAGALYNKHVRDWSDVQEENGWIHHTAPQINQHYGGPMWSSAGQNIARAFYQNFGDKRILELAHPSGKRWLEFLHSKVRDGLLRSYDKHWGKFLGDWAAPEQRKERGDSPEAEFFNNCVYAMNLADFIESSRILNKPDEVTLYSARLEDLKKQVHKVYFNPTKSSYCNGTQVQLAFALLAGITPEALRPAVAASLDKELAAKPYLDMGSSGLPILLIYLIEESDRSAPLYQHLSSTNEPGYGYFLKRGETTWPEYWNVDVPSRIHTCYTGISSWLTKTVAGIRPDPEHPGFQSFIIAPLPGGDLTFAETSMESPFGTISSRWERKDSTFKLDVTVPANSQATVFIPTTDASGLTEGGNPLRDLPGITRLRVEGVHAVIRVEAGKYQFHSKMN